VGLPLSKKCNDQSFVVFDFYQILLTPSQAEFVHKNIGHRNVLRFSKEKAAKQFLATIKMVIKLIDNRHISFTSLGKIWQTHTQNNTCGEC
jgi:hypothetical protein